MKGSWEGLQDAEKAERDEVVRKWRDGGGQYRLAEVSRGNFDIDSAEFEERESRDASSAMIRGLGPLHWEYEDLRMKIEGLKDGLLWIVEHYDAGGEVVSSEDFRKKVKAWIESAGGLHKEVKEALERVYTMVNSISHRREEVRDRFHGYAVQVWGLKE